MRGRLHAMSIQSLFYVVSVSSPTENPEDVHAGLLSAANTLQKGMDVNSACVVDGVEQRVQ